jgi:hypothetical protein
MANGMIILITLLKKTYDRLNIMRKSRIFLDRYSLEKNSYFYYKTFNGVRWGYMGSSKAKFNK